MINIAVIGAGRIGAIHAGNVASHPQTRLAWVSDPVPAARARLAPLGACLTSDPAEAIVAADVDAVIVCSPTPTHVNLIRLATAAGKPVLCEKPVDLDLARAVDCLATVGGPVMIGFNRRFDPSFAEVRARVAAGEIGQVEQLTIISRDPAPPGPEYVAVSGGLFRDMTIHDFDMARFFLGPIATVRAAGQNLVDPRIGELGDIDGAVVILTAASGATATILNSRRCAYGYDQRLEAFGSAGLLEARNQYATSVAVSCAATTGARGRVQDFFLERYAAAYRLELDAFVRAITAGEAPRPDLRDGCEALNLADAALRSLATGAAVTVPSL
ncbi:MAG: inositol 2-dehydrogenase [Propionibacteriaceae bacterium]|nr:inositol 2-dehydrogenase [Propionibacteriaceae bacterium]